MAESFNPDTVWAPFGAFSQIVVAGPGKLVFLKGQVALDREGRIVGAGDMRRQVAQVLANIEALLSAMNGRLSDIVSLSQFTTDIAAFMQAGDVRARFFKPPYPVTTTVEVASLYDPNLLIEITATAEIPMDRYQAPEAATALHQ